MHRLCVGCHIKKAKENNKPEMARCAWCHKERRDVLDSRTLVLRRIAGENVVMPPAEIGK